MKVKKPTSRLVHVVERHSTLEKQVRLLHLEQTKSFCMSKTDIKTFEVTFLDDDISMLSDDLQYSTIGNGYGLQSNIPKNSVDYSRLYILCNQVRKELLEIKQLLRKYGK